MSSSLLTYRPRTDAAPRLGRAPWRDLADVLEDRTQSLSPPPVELSVYHPLQTTTPHRPPTPTPSSTGTSPSRFESAPTSPKISRSASPTTIPRRTSQPPAISFTLTLEEKKTYLTSTAPTSSGPNSPKWIGRSWELQGPPPGSGDATTSRTGPLMGSQARESRWPSSSLSTEGNRSALLTPHPYPSDLSSTPTGGYGIPPPGEGYSPFDPEPLTSKQPWRMPSPVWYGRKSHGAPELSCEFPRGYAAGYDLPKPLPDSPPLRRHGTYRGEGKSHLIAAAGDDKMEGGGPGLPDEPGPTDEERIEQARDLYE